MPKRFTITEKWDDKWFRKLPPYQKLLWNFLCDKCNLAGFWEIDLDLAQEKTLIPKRAILGAVQGLNRGYVSNGRHLWLKHFIEHQGNLPLNPKNNAHKHIIGLLEKFQPAFPDVDFYEEMKTHKEAPTEELISPSSKSNSKGSGKGKEYSVEFEFFWKRFKGRWDEEKGRYVKVGKWEAFEEWENLTLEEKRKAAKVADRAGGKYTPDACRWLKRKLFDDFPDQKNK